MSEPHGYIILAKRGEKHIAWAYHKAFSAKEAYFSVMHEFPPHTGFFPIRINEFNKCT